MTELIGHRGYPAIYPENTLLSFREAVNAGCDGVELDVRLTKDNKVIVIHDKVLQRTTNGRGFVSDFTLKELKGFTAGKGEKIPALQEVIKEFKSIKLLIELKTDSVKDMNRLCRETAKIAGKGQDVLFISFSIDALRYSKEKNPDFKTGLIFSKKLIEPERYGRFLDALCPRRDMLDANIMAFAGRYKLKTYVWTVDTKDDLKAAVKYGVTGIVTNDPGGIRKYL